MRPLHEVDLLELAERHVRVQEGELGRGAVLGELGVPVFGGHGGAGAGDWFPFSDAQSRTCVSDLGVSFEDELCAARGKTKQTNPDSVKRVSPPKTTMPKTLTALPKSQYATPLELVFGNELLSVTSVVAVAVAVVVVAPRCLDRADISCASFASGVLDEAGGG